MAMEGGGGQRIFISNVELGVAILKKFKIVPGLIRRQATLGTVDVNNLLGVDKLASHVIHLPPQTILKRRRGMATSFSAVPLA